MVSILVRLEGRADVMVGAAADVTVVVVVVPWGEAGYRRREGKALLIERRLEVQGEVQEVQQREAHSRPWELLR